MQSVKAKVAKSLPVGSMVPTTDNSGAKVLKIISVVGGKTRHGRIPSAGVGDLVVADVKVGRPDIRKQVVHAIIVRQKKEYRRLDGTRIKFEDNAAIVLKDEKGNPKGTMFKGAIAKEVCERWPAVAKLSRIVV